jgi:uncharacterized membrane protein (DUF373 family)
MPVPHREALPSVVPATRTPSTAPQWFTSATDSDGIDISVSVCEPDSKPFLPDQSTCGGSRPAGLAERSLTDVPQTAEESKARVPPQRESPRLFEHIERALAIGIGILLSSAALLALTGAATLVWDGAVQWPQTRSLFGIVERLLFVLMLVEILHTVRASIQSHVLASEPFLIVGVIATIRRILVVTLETSDRPLESNAPPGSLSSFDNAMIELSVLGLLTLVLAVAIYLSRRGKA